MNPMPRQSGKRFSIVAATALACTAWFTFASETVAAPQSPSGPGAAMRSTMRNQHATSGPDVTPLSRCADLPPLDGPAGKARTVTEFGAVPDDERDDTAAIQRALDALRPGDWLVFPPGRYVHSTRLRVQVQGVKLWGRGAVLHASNPADMAVMLMADGASIYGFTLTAITEKRGNKPHEARIAIHPRSNDAPMLRGNEVRGNRIVADAARDPRAANSATTTGVFVYRARDFLVADNYVERSLADGIHITAGSAFGRVVRNTVRETGDDMIGMVSYLGDGVFTRNTAADLAATLPRRTEAKLVHDVLVADNDLAGLYWGRGISVVGGRDITILRNRIAESTHAAAVYLAREANYVTFGVHNVRVQDNVIEKVQTTKPRYSVGHAMAGRSGHAAIQLHADLLEDERGHPALAAALALADIAIVGNRVDGAASGGLRISAARASLGPTAPVLSNRRADGVVVARRLVRASVQGVSVRSNRFQAVRGAALAWPDAVDDAPVHCAGNQMDGRAIDGAMRCTGPAPAAHATPGAALAGCAMP